MTKKELSWKPERRGAIYCAPACGGRCKHRDYLKAKRTAEGIARKLGAGWEAEVFENLGWHWKVKYTRGDHDSELYVMKHGIDQFWASMVIPGTRRQYTFTGSSPANAVEGVMRSAMDCVLRTQITVLALARSICR